MAAFVSEKSKAIDFWEIIISSFFGAVFSEILREILVYVKAHKGQIYKRFLTLAESDKFQFLVLIPLPLCLSTLIFEQIIVHLIPPLRDVANSFLGGTVVVPLLIAISFTSVICAITYDYNPPNIPKWLYTLAIALPLVATSYIIDPIMSILRADIRIVGDNFVRSKPHETIYLIYAQYTIVQESYSVIDF